MYASSCVSVSLTVPRSVTLPPASIVPWLTARPEITGGVSTTLTLTTLLLDRPDLDTAVTVIESVLSKTVGGSLLYR